MPLTIELLTFFHPSIDAFMLIELLGTKDLTPLRCLDEIITFLLSLDFTLETSSVGEGTTMAAAAFLSLGGSLIGELLGGNLSCCMPSGSPLVA